MTKDIENRKFERMYSLIYGRSSSGYIHRENFIELSQEDFNRIFVFSESRLNKCIFESAEGLERVFWLGDVIMTAKKISDVETMPQTRFSHYRFYHDHFGFYSKSIESLKNFSEYLKILFDEDKVRFH